MKNQTKKSPKKSQPKRLKAQRSLPQTFGEHIAELRRRLFVVGLFFLVGSTLAYTYRKELLDIILAPLNGQQLVYLTPGGGFTFIFQVSIYAGLILAAPVLVYQLHSFIRPALPERAQKSINRVTMLSTLLIVGGIAYGYFVAIPAAIQFLSAFAEGVVAPNLTADSYLSFFLAYVGGLALLSLIPLVLMFWHWINPLTPGGVAKSEQWIVVLAFILAAIITPTPDVLNQAMIAVPVIGVYQIGVIAVLTSIARVRRHERQAIKQPVVQTTIASLPALSPVIQPLVSITETTTPQKPTAILPRQPVPQRRPIDGFNAVRRSTPRILPASRPLSPRERSHHRPSRQLSMNGLVRG